MIIHVKTTLVKPLESSAVTLYKLILIDREVILSSPLFTLVNSYTTRKRHFKFKTILYEICHLLSNHGIWNIVAMCEGGA